MTQEQKESKLNEVNQILRDNGIDIKFRADWGTGCCEIKYKGESVFEIENEDCTIKLGNDPDIFY